MEQMLEQLKARGFDEFQPDTVDLPPNVVAIGDHGEMGGKAKGTVVDSLLVQLGPEAVADEYGELVAVPESRVLLTGIYEEFLTSNRLMQVIDDADDERLRARFLEAQLPDEVRDQLNLLLKDFTFPLAIRSSSTLEDSMQHPTSGMYLTTFTANRGSQGERLANLERRIKLVYASMFGPPARAYRKRAGIAPDDEAMAVLIQRLIGSQKDGYFFPAFAGVAFSRNYYRWSSRIKPEDGAVRIVYGLGTNAVEGDYARLFSLTHPEIRPEGLGATDIAASSQRGVDVLSLETDQLQRIAVPELIQVDRDGFHAVGSWHDTENNMLSSVRPSHSRNARPIITFNRVVSRFSPLVKTIEAVLASSERALKMPVDCEFAVELNGGYNPAVPKPFTFYKVQTRPLGSRIENRYVEAPPEDEFAHTLLRTNTLVGNGHITNIRHIAFVTSETYRQIYTNSDQLGNAIRALRLANERWEEGYMLIGPGRWGTSDKTTGIPVAFEDIDNAQVIVELGTDAFAPVFSYGSHFFKNFYLSTILHPVVYFQLNLRKSATKQRHYIDLEWLQSAARPSPESPHVQIVNLDTPLEVFADGSRGVGYAGWLTE